MIYAGHKYYNSDPLNIKGGVASKRLSHVLMIMHAKLSL